MPDALRCDFRVDLRPGLSVEACFTLGAGALVLFGPTGAGKTVIVRAIAGLERPTAGRIVAGGEVLCDVGSGKFVPPQARAVGYAPQHGSLFPHLRVRDNVLVGVPVDGAAGDRNSGRQLDEALVDAFGLGPLLDRSVNALSGGERQRVALARALARHPRRLLLDEPLSALHLPERRRLARWVKAWAAERGVTTVLVTHDPEEARAIGDHLALIESGRTVAEGPPDDILARLDTAES